jgi:glutamine synthetase
MASKQIIPAIVKYTKSLADTVIAVTNAEVDASVQKELLAESSELLKEAKDALTKLITVQKEAISMKEGKEQAFFYKDYVKVAMEELRIPIDKLEMIVDKDMWPMPSYGDLLFEV